MRLGGNLWSWWITLTGRPRNWTVGTVFFLVGLLIGLIVPLLIPVGPDRNAAVILLRLLGGMFVLLGAVLLISMAVDAYLGTTRDPARRERWFALSTVLTGALAAGLFAVPATLMFPFMLWAFATRPNTFFPADDPNPANNLVVSGIFSILGVATFGLMAVVLRQNASGRPRRSRRSQRQTVKD